MILFNFSIKIFNYNWILDPILVNIASFIFMFTFLLSLTLFYLDNLKLSNIKFVKYFQVFSVAYMLILILFISYEKSIISLQDIVCYMTDNNKDVNLHGHVSVNKEAGKAIGQGLQTIGTQIGLGATMAGVAAAVGKAVTKTGMPPIQKAGIILGSSVISGLAHSRISIMNRNVIHETDLNSSSSTDASSNISKFISDSISSPLQDLLVNFEMMSYVCLSLIYIIVIQLLFKLYFKDKINLKNFHVLNTNWWTNINYYLNKIIKSNKQMSIIWTWIGVLLVTFALCLDAYTLHDLYNNIDSYVNIHNSMHSNSAFNNLYVVDTSILDRLLFSRIINFVSIITMLYLILHLIQIFHFKKSLSNTIIWILITLLILDLAFSAYIYNDLYTNIDSYVNMHISTKNK
jgi:hypothetical protein